MKKLKIVDKYLTKQILETFIMGIVVFTSIMLASDAFITLIKQISHYGIPFKIALLIIILQLPSMLVMSIPMGVLLATVMTINKLCINSEISIMRACGIGVNRIARPVFAFALIAGLCGFLINEFIVPPANTQVKNLTLWAISQKNVPEGATNFSFREMKDDKKLKRLFYVEKCKNRTLYGITMLDMSKDNTIQLIQAKSGITSPQYWEFQDGVLYTMATSGKVLNTTIFEKFKLPNSFTASTKKLKSNKASELNFFALSKYIKDNKEKLGDNYRALKVQLYDKIAIPITTVVFVIIGVPLAITPPRVRYNRGFLFSILIIFLYYLLRAFSISLGETGSIAPFLAAWMPNLVITMLGGIMYYRKAFTIA